MEADTKPDLPEEQSAKPWLMMLDESEKAFNFWQEKCDSVDKLYADLKHMADGGTDRELQIFWANLEILRPSVYNREPVPVVAPRFRDRRPIPRAASEVLERALVTDFETDNVHETLKLVRDDMLTGGRGVPWIRYGNRENVQAAIVDHVSRKDFRHGVARKWKEVPWVAKLSYLKKGPMEKRFGKLGLKAKFEERDLGLDSEGHKDGASTRDKTAKVWEIWHKIKRKVVWVSPGMEEILDIQDPHLDLTGFFPCPKPAYGTVQRETLIPVPDFVFYRDQLEEINLLTARISSLAEAMRMKGFYPGGAADIADAIEAAVQNTDDNAILIPIANMATLGGGSVKDSIVWLPVNEVAQTIAQLVELRRQMIEDVYEVTGLSDIMRGSTNANETASAQQIKSQYGSIRLTHRQEEMVRVARDVTRLKAEIMAENFDAGTLLQMSQVEIPTREMMQHKQAQAQAKFQEMAQNPEMVAKAQQNPEMAQQAIQQHQTAMQEMSETVTIEDVMELLDSQRMRAFTLEIETDSTIQPNEDAEKQRRVEFLTAVGGFLSQALPLVAAQPEAAGFVAESLKFTAGGFRAGREMDSAIDEFAEKIKEVASQPRPDPGQMEAELKAKAEEAKLGLEKDKVGLEAKRVDIEEKKVAAEIQKPEPAQDTSVEMAKLQIEKEKADRAHALEIMKMNQQAALEREKMQLDAELRREEIQARKEQASKNRPVTED